MERNIVCLLSHIYLITLVSIIVQITFYVKGIFKLKTPNLLVYSCVYLVYSSVLMLLYFSVVFGNSNGLAVVDYLQKTLLLNMGTSELYSPSEPYQRQPRSPRKARQPSGGEL